MLATGLWYQRGHQRHEHGKVAAGSIVGEPVKYRADAPPPVQLKVPGISLCSFSRIKAEEGEEQLTYENEQLHQWMRMVVKGNRVVGWWFCKPVDRGENGIEFGQEQPEC